LLTAVLALAAGAAVGCASTSRRPTDERARVESATQRYAAMLRGAPVDSVIAIYAEDGELVIPGVGTLHGRKAIRDFLTPLTAAVTVASVEMQIDSVSVSGSAADERGRYRQVAGPKDGPAQEFRGTFHATWRRDRDAQWRIARLVMEPRAKAP
jgi:uncharacterized protein (TIGR02246 family)